MILSEATAAWTTLCNYLKTPSSCQSYHKARKTLWTSIPDQSKHAITQTRVFSGHPISARWVRMISHIWMLTKKILVPWTTYIPRATLGNQEEVLFPCRVIMISTRLEKLLFRISQLKWINSTKLWTKGLTRQCSPPKSLEALFPSPWCPKRETCEVVLRNIGDQTTLVVHPHKTRIMIYPKWTTIEQPHRQP